MQGQAPAASASLQVGARVWSWTFAWSLRVRSCVVWWAWARRARSKLGAIDPLGHNALRERGHRGSLGGVRQIEDERRDGGRAIVVGVRVGARVAIVADAGAAEP